MTAVKTHGLLRGDDAPGDGDGAVELAESRRGADDHTEPASGMSHPPMAASTHESSARHSSQNGSGAAAPTSAAMAAAVFRVLTPTSQPRPIVNVRTHLRE